MNSLRTDSTSVERLAFNSFSTNSSTSSSSRRSSTNTTDKYSKDNGVGKLEWFDNELEVMGQYTQLSDDEYDDFTPSEPYERFFFESDYLALQDNKHYNLLLQTLVALEAQQMQAIKDLDHLCDEEERVLDNPIGFVEQLQNNVTLDLPAAQNVTKLPNIPWEVYASSFGPLESLSAHPNTRATANQTEKVPQFPASLADDNSASEKISPSCRGSEIIFSIATKSDILEDRSQSIKLRTFNQPWTTEEQTRLEKLLQIYPQEEVESKRWEKIAKALGNRTPKQVASRTQKYFIKLARAGLPIPGRVPHLPKAGARMSRKSNYYSTVGFRNSTFFPSYQPRVYMDNNSDDDDDSSVGFSDDICYLSDDDIIPEDLRQTREYKELLKLKKIKRRKLRDVDKCGRCGVSPITGSRWHCQDCPDSVDFCSFCIEKCSHNRHHRLEPVSRDASFFVDDDYVGISGSIAGYNYLDPNFLPAAN